MLRSQLNYLNVQGGQILRYRAGDAKQLLGQLAVHDLAGHLAKSHQVGCRFRLASFVGEVSDRVADLFVDITFGAVNDVVKNVVGYDVVVQA